MRRLLLSTLGVVVLLAALVAAVLLFRLDGAALAPSGRFGVGTRTVVWTQPDTQRAIPVALAYPAAESPVGVAIARAAPQLKPKHPLVVFAPDVGSTTTFYRSLAYELASRGFVVALVGLPGIERFSRFPDHVVGWDARARAASAARNAKGWPAVGSDEDYAASATVAAKDMKFALDQINEEAHAQVDPLFVSVRVGTVAFAGHGLGGTAALLACPDDMRCDAVVTIDGPAIGSVPFSKPLLAVATSDEPRGLAPLVASATGPTYSAVIGASARLDVTDLPRLLPALFLPSGTVEHPDRATRAARDILSAFLMRHLMQFPVPMLDKMEPIEDVTLQVRNQDSDLGSPASDPAVLSAP
jgi:dienelactone hydrolase